MNWIDKLERKFGRYATPNLMYYIVILYVVGFILQLLNPSFYYQYLALNASEILNGQIWRILTFLIQPPSSSPIFMVFALYLYYMIGRELEYAWGSFRFNLYFFVGVLFHVVGAIVTYFLTSVSLPIGTGYLNLSLFFAYATIYPNQQFLLFFVIPVKVKYLAWIDGAFFAYTILQAFMPAYGGGIFGMFYQANALAAFVSLLNFLLFFVSIQKRKGISPREFHRKKTFQREVHKKHNHRYENGAQHKCAVCGRTELDDPNLEFRYCSKCNGNYEYCQDHLFTHEHKK